MFLRLNFSSSARTNVEGGHRGRRKTHGKHLFYFSIKFTGVNKIRGLRWRGMNLGKFAVHVSLETSIRSAKVVEFQKLKSQMNSVSCLPLNKTLTKLHFAFQECGEKGRILPFSFWKSNLHEKLNHQMNFPSLKKGEKCSRTSNSVGNFKNLIRRNVAHLRLFVIQLARNIRPRHSC
jgi:hypothetical protein